jgi:HK97 family phage major capsid protein
MHAVRFRPTDQRLTSSKERFGQSADGDLRAEQRTDDGPSGGFAIPPQFRAQLLQLTPQQAVVRPRANVIEPVIRQTRPSPSRRSIRPGRRPATGLVVSRSVD